MTTRTGIVCVAACACGLALFAGMDGTVRAAGESVIQTAELPDMPLGTFHNSLFRSSADHIVDDHGVRMGSLGSDIFHGPNDSYNEFWAVTDRGPNGNPGKRTFLAPSFNPLIMYVRVHGTSISILQAIPIVDTSGRPVTGMSNVSGFDETPWDYNGANEIHFNSNGLDTEGLVRTSKGDFWLVDEYSPSLIHVGPDGMILDRFVPVDSQLASVLSNTPNYRVRKYLPAILNKRRSNRGFEGIAISPDESTLYLAMQSPLDYPTNALGRASRNVRIVRFDIASEQVTGDFVYHFEEVCAFSHQPAGCGIAPGEMKISGLAAISSTSLLVVERTDLVAKIYKVDVSAATNILNTAWDTLVAVPTAATTTIETVSSLSSQGITALPKTLVVDLSTLPGMPDKIEGIALVKGDVLAVANDNDFGLTDNPTFDAAQRLASDTKVKSKILYVQLSASLK